MRSAVNLDKKLEESSSALSETNHSKSMAGNKQYCLLSGIINFVVLIKTPHSPSSILHWSNLDSSHPSIFLYFYLISERADRIARALNASAKREV